mmetsp:Transcript_7034/g.12523  ORF Transcript_7034/g.12523 Transcript_7034/m.12523 type:complete len:89 (-) Transcript_7034:226-492(-)
MTLVVELFLKVYCFPCLYHFSRALTATKTLPDLKNNRILVGVFKATNTGFRVRKCADSLQQPNPTNKPNTRPTRQQPNPTNRPNTRAT